MTTPNIELVKDDEVLREQGITSGNTKAARWELRPTCALEISWMQRNNVLQPDMDVFWRASAFAFIHSAPKADIRRSVNDHNAFLAAVDNWMDAQGPSAKEIAELSAAMRERTEEYFASFSTADTNNAGN